METRTLPYLCERALRPLWRRIRRQACPAEKRHFLAIRLSRLFAIVPSSYIRRNLPYRILPQHLRHRPHPALPREDPAKRIQEDTC